MSKKTKRTISSLLKSRPKGRFAPKGFDLLGEGDRLVAGEVVEYEYENSLSILSPHVAVKAPLPSPKKQKTLVKEDSFLGSAPDVNIAVAENAKVKTATAKLTQAGKAPKNAGFEQAEDVMSGVEQVDVNPAVGKLAPANSSIASGATKIPAIVESASANIAIEKLDRAKNTKVKSAIEVSAIEKDAVVDLARDKNTLVNSAVVSNADVDFAIEEDDAAMSAIAKFVQAKAANEDFAVEENVSVPKLEREAEEEKFPAQEEGRVEEINTQAPRSRPSRGVGRDSGHKPKHTATKVAYKEAQEELMRLRAERKTSTLVDNYVIDTLLAELGPTLSIVYIYLWRRTVGNPTKKISLSMQVLSDAVGISKRTAQEAIKKLNELRLLKSNREGETGVSEHQVLKSWEKMK